MNKPMKVSKTSVSYEHPAKIKSHNCGRCVHYVVPSQCEKVLGKVRPEDWCRLWKPLNK